MILDYSETYFPSFSDFKTITQAPFRGLWVLISWGREATVCLH